MIRREFLGLLGSVAGWPLVARAQPVARVKRVGVLGNLPLRPIDQFRKEMRELGYAEGKSVV